MHWQKFAVDCWCRTPHVVIGQGQRRPSSCSSVVARGAGSQYAAGHDFIGTRRIAPNQNAIEAVRPAGQLIDVAKEIILKEGMYAATMKRIAAQAGVSETQAYNYFGS